MSLNGVLAEILKYNNNNMTVERIDGMNRKTAYVYDSHSRLAKTIQYLDGRAVEVVYSYDERGNKISETDYDGLVTNWQYDEMNRVIKKIIPGGVEEIMTYDPSGLLTGRVDYNGQGTGYSYDEIYNRLAMTDYGLEGKAREEIMRNLILQGWIRIRWKPKEWAYTVQMVKDPQIQKNLDNWLMKFEQKPDLKMMWINYGLCFSL